MLQETSRFLCILHNFQIFPVKSQTFLHILTVPIMYQCGKVKKASESKIAITIYSWSGCEFWKKSWFSNFRGPRGIVTRTSRSRGVIISIPWGIEKWKKVWDLEERGTRNSSCPPYLDPNVTYWTFSLYNIFIQNTHTDSILQPTIFDLHILWNYTLIHKCNFKNDFAPLYQ